MRNTISGPRSSLPAVHEPHPHDDANGQRVDPRTISKYLVEPDANGAYAKTPLAQLVDDGTRAELRALSRTLAFRESGELTYSGRYPIDTRVRDIAILKTRAPELVRVHGDAQIGELLRGVSAQLERPITSATALARMAKPARTALLGLDFGRATQPGDRAVQAALQGAHRGVAGGALVAPPPPSEVRPTAALAPVHAKPEEDARTDAPRDAAPNRPSWFSRIGDGLRALGRRIGSFVSSLWARIRGE